MHILLTSLLGYESPPLFLKSIRDIKKSSRTPNKEFTHVSHLIFEANLWEIKPAIYMVMK